MFLATTILEFGAPLVAGASLLGGAAAWLYVPVFGQTIAKGLGVFAIAALVFGAGFKSAADLDKSALLAAQLVQQKADAAEAEQEAATAKTIMAEATAREQAAEQDAETNKQKVADYAAQLAKTPGCALTAADNQRLRAIGAGKRASPLPPSRPK